MVLTSEGSIDDKLSPKINLNPKPANPSNTANIASPIVSPLGTKDGD
jgi:hypothetical protein